MLIAEGFTLVRESTVSNQLAMDKALAIKHLQQAGYSERRIAEQLGISRKAVRHHLGRFGSKDTKALTGSAPTGSDTPKDTKAPTGSEAIGTTPQALTSASLAHVFHDTIVAKLDQGLTAQRIFQDLQTEHGFTAKYHSVRRYIAKLRDTTPLPFRRLECEPGEELQVDFGIGAKCQNADGKWIKTHVFRAVLSHSRKGYSEAVTRLTIERFIQVLENTFWRLGGVPKVVVFDNGSCAVKAADWYDAELHPKINDFCKHYGFALVPTRPRTPRHKGKTERGVGYVKGNALKARTFASLAEQNQYLDQWEATVADASSRIAFDHDDEQSSAGRMGQTDWRRAQRDSDSGSISAPRGRAPDHRSQLPTRKSREKFKGYQSAHRVGCRREVRQKIPKPRMINQKPKLVPFEAPRAGTL